MAEAQNQKWTSDITYIPTQEFWLYLVIILDLFSRKVVDWAISSSMTCELVCKAFQMDVARRRPGWPVFDSPFRSRESIYERQF
ncbi:MAG: DDE-type integrase/transposase/recombinase [Chloroflexota bacterium]